MKIVPAYAGLDYHNETSRVRVLDGETFVNRSIANDPAAVLDLVRTNGELVRAVAIEACCSTVDLATAWAEMTRWTVRIVQLGGMNRVKNGPDKTGIAGRFAWQHELRVATRSHDERRRQLHHSSIKPAPQVRM